jgi:hypothetical protein
VIEHIDAHGSFVTRGKRYSVAQFRGPVGYRQDYANKLHVQCYAEAHLNAHTQEGVNYAMAIAAHQHSVHWGSAFTRRAAEAFGHPDNGVLVMSGRGSGLVARVKWPAPALVLEPGFISNPEFAAWSLTGEGIDALGRALAESILECIEPGLIGLSIGHNYRGTGDMGAPVHPDHDDHPEWDQEAEIAEAYVDAATQYLVGYE